MPESKEIFIERDPKTVTQATLCFLFREIDGNKQILLGMKKRGFGIYKWNGLGGKVEKNEDIIEAAKREAYDESRLKVDGLRKMAILHFYFPNDPAKREGNWDVHVFLVDNWNGELEETDEMKPQWFDIKDIPYEQMWDDDWVWLPQVLEGKIIVGHFAFDDGDKMIAHQLQEVSGF